MLVRDGRDPSAFVGALLPATITGGLPATARRGHGEVFVVEADEYAGNFDPYRPDVALVLNAEWDHPDVFADEDAVLDAFAGWLQRAVADGRRPTLIANVGSAGVAKLVGSRLEGWPGAIVTVNLRGRSSVADVDGWTEIVAGRTRLLVSRRDRPETSFDVSLAGNHNAENALALVGAASVLGVGDEALRASLAEFGGVGRRLELKGEPNGVTVYDDYGHHPTAIARTLEAVRQRHPGRRLWAVYEPLTFHRTARMLDQFADVLAAGADRVAIADIWAGRDPDTTLTSSQALADAVNARRAGVAAAPGAVEATADFLADSVMPADVVLVMGGGRSYVIAERLVELLTGADR
jgi:UDP-N-acetylmuramate--alanine ligase